MPPSATWRSPRLAVAIAVAVLVAACSSSDPPLDAEPGQASVVAVVDGDTIEVRLAGSSATERVRLIGIDTPESVDPRTPVECYGPEAAERARAFLPEGTVVRLERDVEVRDRYDRLLAYVHRADDDLFVNLALVAEGFAEPLPYPPNTAHAADLAAAADTARAGGLGLWGACGPRR